jgi:hypothetical protein
MEWRIITGAMAPCGRFRIDGPATCNGVGDAFLGEN